MKALLLVLAAMPALASAADLDAPLKPQPPTLRSEIKRGADAGRECEGRFGDDLSGQALLACLNEAQTDNRQRMGRGYEAFEAGLWFRGRERLAIAVKVAPSAFSSGALGVAASSLRSAELGAGVSDDDVVKAIYS